MYKVKVLVTKEDDPSWSAPYEFGEDVITIGRDGNSNLLHLPDPKRIVGRKHAKIERQGEVVQIIDLGAKNFTFLNNKKLVAGRAYTLEKDDYIKIGDFNIQFLSLDAITEPPKTDDREKTMFVINPFDSDINEFARVLKRIYTTYSSETPNRRKAALNAALLTAMAKIEPNEAGTIIANSLQAQGKTSPEQAFQPETQQTPFFERLFNILMQTVIKLINSLWKFRLEFAGITIIQSPNSFPIHTSSAEELKQYLLSEEISEQEFNDRLAIFKDEIKLLMLHQVALLDGYKACVAEGSHKLLQKIDPIFLEQELAKKSIKLGPIEISYRYLPIFFHWKLFQLYRERHRALIKEDRTVFERRIFRDGFIRAYFERFSSAQRERKNR